MEKLKKRFPAYVWITIAAVLCVQIVVYSLSKLLIDPARLHHLETSWDYAIPFRPGWVIIYFMSFVSWAVSGLLIVSDDKERGVRFAASYSLALAISGIIFLTYPGTLTRPEITGNGFIAGLMRFLYWIDEPMNLCPSLHVMLSYYCWRGMIPCRKLPKWCKWFNLVFFVLVCFSILFVKQHVLIDIPSAILIGEFCIQLTDRIKPERRILALFEKHPAQSA